MADAAYLPVGVSIIAGFTWIPFFLPFTRLRHGCEIPWEGENLGKLGAIRSKCPRLHPVSPYLLASITGIFTVVFKWMGLGL
jgi:hypothetical protein